MFTLKINLEFFMTAKKHITVYTNDMRVIFVIVKFFHDWFLLRDIPK